MVLKALVAAKSAGLGKRSLGTRTARRERHRLIVTEPRISRIVGREIVVQPDVKLGFIQLANGREGEVEALSADIGLRIQVQQGLANGVGKVTRNFVAGSSASNRCLGAICVRGNGIASRIALEPCVRG